MQTKKKVEISQYEGVRLPYRIAVGDIIRCKSFANCFLLCVHVAGFVLFSLWWREVDLNH